MSPNLIEPTREAERRSGQMISNAIDAWELAWQSYSGPADQRDIACSEALIAAIADDLALASKIFFTAHKIMETIPAVKNQLSPFLPEEWLWARPPPD